MQTEIPPGIDQDIFQEMQTVMEEEFTLLIEVYLEDTPELLDQIAAAISAEPRDFPSLTNAAHQIKSTSASLGFVELASLAQTLEKKGTEQNDTELSALYQSAIESLSVIRPHLENQLN
ncbi:MAG: Hpt domain-containing protein [Gammaproteobacteria bacterium]